MAPSQSVWSRIRGMVNRITSRRRTKSSITKQPAALANKASSPEAPQAASQQPNKPQDQSEVRAATTMPTLQIALQNQTSSSQVYAYITGQAIDNNSALFLLSADAKTAYYPPSPSSTGQPLGQDVSIQLGAPGSTVTATIPRIAGGRIWFSVGKPLQFFVNPGPGLVEPSIFNPSDPNVDTNFGFCEFTYNSWELFINISYVDFVSAVPIALTLKNESGATSHVSGMKPDGLEQICKGLQDQTAKDGRRWSSLIVKSKSGQNLRALSPNSGILLNPSWFKTYWDDYVNQVWSRYTTQPLTINTQASFGNVNGQVTNNALTYANGTITFQKPTARDIFGCSTGPFQTGGNQQTNAIIPRLAAAFNRSTLLLASEHPNKVGPAQYYQNAVTNHYSRLVHAANIDGKGYAFPYDDVTPDGGVGQEGAMSSPNPALLTVTVGGLNAYVA